MAQNIFCIIICHDATPNIYKGFYNAVIMKNMYNSIHPSGQRFNTIREFMSLMGLPDDFTLIGGINNFNHIAQNVPVNTASDIVRSIKKFIDGELVMSDFSFVKQNNTHQKVDVNVNL